MDSSRGFLTLGEIMMVATVMELLMVTSEIVMAKWLKWQCWLGDSCLRYISHCCNKTADISNLRWEGLTLPCSFRKWYLRAEKSWWQVREAAGPLVFLIRKEREMHAYAQIVFSLCGLGS